MAAYLRVRGGGTPVVFIAQLGTGGESWQPIIDRLPDVTTFAYDRPGTGTAPPRAAPNPPLPVSAFAAELADLLEQHDLTQPAVIVGHSLGGNIARVYAGRHPDRVAGLVFVDASMPQTFFGPGEDTFVDGDNPDSTEVDTVRGQVDILTSPIPDVPAVVLTRTHGRWSGTDEPPHPAYEDLWLVSQRILARDHRAPLIVADNSGHQIPAEAPDLVLYAIEQVLEAVRTKQPVRVNLDRLLTLGGHLDDQPVAG
jgi:pimeloyl-ACP methyl ester carboxylesterase